MTMGFIRPLMLVLVFVAFAAYNQQSSFMDAQAAAEANDAVENAVGKGASLSDFHKAITAMAERALPIIDATTFDNFIDEDDVNPIDDRALKIEALYPDFYEDEAKYRAMASYKVALSPNFHSVVVTYKLGEHEMETSLINYDADGNILDHQLIAYDEVADGNIFDNQLTANEEIAYGLTQIKSRLGESVITTHHITWDLVKEIEEQEIAINFDGSIEKIVSRKLSQSLADYALILSVLEELGIDPLAVKTDLIASKANPQNSNEVIVAIPEIMDEGEQYFDLNSHVLIADTRSGAIIHKYFESSQTNQWVSDAIALKEISIDTAPYRMAENVRAFGVRVRYSGMSRVNPYESETLSLFIRSGDRLNKVLNEYPMKLAIGEWDGDCSGAFTDTQNILLMSDQKSNGFSDIKIKSRIVTTKNEVNSNSECDAIETEAFQVKELKFNGIEYKSVD